MGLYHVDFDEKCRDDVIDLKNLPGNLFIEQECAFENDRSR